ncbi:MAG: hypothetical protein ACR2RV_18050, partial [Verrucomicrobiales bacterium]
MTSTTPLVTICATFLIWGVLASVPAEASIFGRKKPGVASQGEYLIVSGGPALQKWEELRVDRHDRWWGNFIRSARIRMQQLIGRDSRHQITWLVFRPAYSSRAAEDGQPRIDHVRSVRTMFARDYQRTINLVWFDSTADLVNYVNDRDRSNKVVGFEFFGHSNAPAFMFDYSNDISGASKAWLHQDELHRFRRRAFDRDAFCKSWGCYSGQSFCRAFRRATGVAMWGATDKTDYSVLKDNRLPVISNLGTWVL